MNSNSGNTLTLRSFVAGVLFSGLFALLTVYAGNRFYLQLTATQIPVLPYALLFAAVFLINPLCRLLRFARPFTQAEILVVFMMGAVSAGISSFGLSEQIIPFAGSLFNRAWNTEQTQWNTYITPYINEKYFLSETGLRNAAKEHLQALEARESAAQALAKLEREPAAEAETLAAGKSLIEAEARANDTKNTLRKLEEAAFAKVDVFRRGLPPGLRSYPGILKLGEDTAAGYMARLKRMTLGRGVAADLRKINKAYNSPENPDTKEITAALERISANFKRMSDTSALKEQLEILSTEEDKQRGLVSAKSREISALHKERREAPRGSMFKLDREIAAQLRARQSLSRGLKEVRRRREAAQKQIDVLSNGASLAPLAQSLAGKIAQDSVALNELGPELRQLADGLRALDGTLKRFLLGEVPWKDWAGPLGRWALLIACTYMVIMALNVLVFRQWAYHEKLIYPLAELPMALTGLDTDGSPSESLYKNGLFWLGASISGLTLGYNVLVATQRLPGLQPIKLDHPWLQYIVNTKLEGLTYGRFSRADIFFTMIGLSFLIPTKVSFSLWFFSLFSMLQVLFLVSLGFGQNEASFPHDWYYTLNFRTAQGFGALIVFASLVLYKCRAYLGCIFKSDVLRELESDERIELRIASAVFIFGSLSAILIFWLGMGANPIHALVAWMVIIILTIGLVRAVAEGGILGFQAWVSPFHLIRTLFGMDKSWTSPTLFAPIVVFYSALFVDIKTFIAPAMANCLKMRDSLRLARGRFHASMAFAIATAAVVACVMSLLMCYADGADLMSRWFYTSNPGTMFSTLTTMTRSPPDAAPGQALWLAGGGAAMALLLFFRRSLFWLPHPIGMVMLINPLMGRYWFSILLGWACKAVVTRYGNKSSYARVKALFIGLIAGELILVVAGMYVAYRLEVPVPVTLNR